MPVKNDEIVVSSTTDSEEEVNQVAGVEEEEELEEKEDQEESEENKEDKEESQDEEETEEKKDEEKDKKEEPKEEDGKKEEKGSAKEESEEEEEEDRSKWPKGMRKMQKRIDKLTAKLAKYESTKEEEVEEEKEEEEPEQVMAEDRPRRKDFKTQEEYEDAIADWRIDQREAKRAIEAQQVQTQKEFNAYNSHLKEFEDSVEDLDEVKDKIKAAGIEIPEAVQVTIIQEDRPDIAYALAKDLETCKRLVEINKTSPAKAVVALTKFIVEHDAAKAAKEKAKPVAKKPVAKAAKTEVEEEEEKPVKKVVKPPAAKAPVSQVKSGSGTGSHKKPLDAEEVDYQEYKRRREAGER